MILPSMTLKEMYDALNADARKVQIRIEKILPKAIRQFKKLRTFPAMYVDQYRIPSTNNEYILFFYAGNVSEAEQPRYSSFNIFYSDRQRFVMRGMKMGYQHTPKSELVMVPQIHVYTSHFFQRYNERFLHREELSPNEIAGLYFVRNKQMAQIKLNEAINKRFEEYGEFNYGMRVDDGFCFTQFALEGKESDDGISEHDIVDAMVFIYKTYVNESMMNDTQQIAIEKEHFETFTRGMEIFMNKM